MKECIELEECEAIDLGDNGPHQQNRLLNLLGYIAREGYTYQDGSDSGAPAVIYADADYEIGDGKCGLHETVKSANEPAIVYVRADTVLAQQSAIDTLTARVAELEDGKIWSRIRSELSNCENLMHVVTEATTYERVASSLDEIARRCARAALKGGDA